MDRRKSPLILEIGNRCRSSALHQAHCTLVLEAHAHMGNSFGSLTIRRSVLGRPRTAEFLETPEDNPSCIDRSQSQSIGPAQSHRTQSSRCRIQSTSWNV